MEWSGGAGVGVREDAATRAEADDPGRGWALPVAVVLGATGAVLLYRFRAFVIDDAFISLRYAAHLASGKGAVWNADGTPVVEGYTSVAHVALLAGLELVGIRGVTALHALSLATLALLLLLTAKLTTLVTGSRRMGVLAASLVLGDPWVGVHTWGGLETVLFAAQLVAVALLYCSQEVHSARTGARFGALAGATFLVRPEGALVGGLLALSCALRSRRGGLAAVVAAPLAFAAVIGATTAIRYLAYGELVPNTFFVKQRYELVGFNVDDLQNFAWKHAPLLVLAAGGIWGARARRASWQVAAAFLVLVLYYQTVLPVMNYHHRFLTPFVPMLVVLATHGWGAIAGRFATTGLVRAGVALIPLLALVRIVATESTPIVEFARTYGEGLRTTHAWLGQILRDHGPDDGTVAVGDAGAIPYYSGLRAIDFLGLNDPHIGRVRDSRYRSGLDVDYVLRQRPEVLVLASRTKHGFRDPRSGIRLTSSDIVRHPLAKEYRELARKQFGTVLGYESYWVVVLVRPEVSAPLERPLKEWAESRRRVAW